MFRRIRKHKRAYVTSNTSIKLISKSLNASHCLSKDETVYILNEKRDWVVSSGDRGKYGAKGNKLTYVPGRRTRQRLPRVAASKARTFVSIHNL
jgi:hypothetical protein